MRRRKGQVDESHGLFPPVSQVMASVLFDGFHPEIATPQDPHAWAVEADNLIRFRLAGVALSVASRGGIKLDPIADQKLRKAQRLDASLSMQAESTAVGVFEALDKEGTPYLVNKGPATARFHPQPQLRPYRDIDLLVPSANFGRVLRLLQSLGFSDLDAKVQPRNYFASVCREGVNLSRGDGSLDLHHVIPPWIWGAHLSFEALASSSEELRIGTRMVPIVGRVDGLLATALHLLSDRLHPGRELMIWRDVLAFLRHTSQSAILERARQLKLAGILGFILNALPTGHRPEGLALELSKHSMPSHEELRLRRLLSSRTSGHQLAYFYRLPLKNAAAFALGYLLPSRTFLEARYGESSWQLIRWWLDAFRSVPTRNQ